MTRPRGRPRNPPLTQDEFARRVLDALAESGGSIGRHDLRTRVGSKVHTEEFERRIGAMIAEGRVVASRTIKRWTTWQGIENRKDVQVYRLGAAAD